MTKGLIRPAAILAAALLTVALAGGPGPAHSSSTMARARSQSQVQTQVETQVQTRTQDQTACATPSQLQTQERARIQQGALVESIEGVGTAALQTSLTGKGDVLHTRDQLRDGSCQLEDSVTVFSYLIAYDNSYDHDYDYGYDFDFDHLHDGPPPEGGYGSHGS